jgi:hypothetical protein
MLEQQEIISVGDFVCIKKVVVDRFKTSTDPWDALLGKTSPKAQFEVLGFHSNGQLILKGWCIIENGESSPIPLDPKLLRKVKKRKKP